MPKKHNFCYLLCAVSLLLSMALLEQAEAAAPRAVGGFSKQICQRDDVEETEAGEQELLHQTFAVFLMDEELQARYPALFDAVIGMNREDWARAQETREDFLEKARERNAEFPEDIRAFAHECDILMRRADSRVVSLLRYEYSYTGGVHGNYGYQGVNLNTETGERIALSDVFADRKKLSKVIMKRLRKKYPENSFEHLEKELRERAAAGTLNWTLDPRGVTFYFNPYEIASYAEGVLTVTILFKEEPKLFHPAWLSTADAYAQPFSPSYLPLETSLRDNKKKDAVHIYGDGRKLYIEVNGKKSVFDAALRDIQPVLLHSADGKNYLYVEGALEDEERWIFAFQIKDESVRLLGTLPYTFRRALEDDQEEQEAWLFLTNPEGFYIHRNASDRSGSTMTDICAVGEDGLLTYG